jgi:hypothetical protein
MCMFLGRRTPPSHWASHLAYFPQQQKFLYFLDKTCFIKYLFISQGDLATLIWLMYLLVKSLINFILFLFAGKFSIWILIQWQIQGRWYDGHIVAMCLLAVSMIFDRISGTLWKPTFSYISWTLLARIMQFLFWVLLRRLHCVIPGFSFYLLFKVTEVKLHKLPAVPCTAKHFQYTPQTTSFEAVTWELRFLQIYTISTQFCYHQ